MINFTFIFKYINAYNHLLYEMNINFSYSDLSFFPILDKQCICNKNFKLILY